MMPGWCVQLFSKQSAAAEARRVGGPTPIKFNLKLGGFGSAMRLDDQGCARDWPPYRSPCHPRFLHILMCGFVPVGTAATIVIESQHQAVT